MKNPYVKEAHSEKGVHSPQPTNLTIHKEIRWHNRVCDDRLNGWLQYPAGDPVYRDPPARGHHTGFVCGGHPSPLWSCRREVRVYHQTALRGSTPDFPSRFSPEVFFTSGYFRKTVGARNQSFPSPR